MSNQVLAYQCCRIGYRQIATSQSLARFKFARIVGCWMAGAKSFGLRHRMVSRGQRLCSEMNGSRNLALLYPGTSLRAVHCPDCTFPTWLGIVFGLVFVAAVLISVICLVDGIKFVFTKSR